MHICICICIYVCKSTFFTIKNYSLYTVYAYMYKTSKRIIGAYNWRLYYNMMY